MKKFLIIGNTNAITYKEIFPLMKGNKLWLGCSSFNSGMYFKVPDNYEYSETYKFDKEKNGCKVMRVSSICWYTNMEHYRRHEPLDLYKKYTKNENPRYDNYNAIEVAKVADIPVDYDGVMGVPITFLDKYCPEQFDVVWIASGSTRANTPQDVLDNVGFVSSLGSGNPILNGKILYPRILIRHKH